MHTSFIRQHSTDLGVLKRFDESSHLNHSICSPLRTYNTLNNLTYTLHTPLKHRILHANTLCRAHNLMSLHTYTVQNHNAFTSKTCHFDTYPNPNSPCAHLFILIIFDPISHIYAVHTQRKALSFHASSHLYSKFRYLIKSTRDPINISQTVHFFTSSYL